MNPIYNLCITPIYLILIYWLIAPFFAKRWTNKYTKKYFWRGLHAKMFGAIFICLIYQFYYGYGDSTLYFYNAVKIFKAFNIDFNKGIEILLYNGDLGSNNIYIENNFYIKNSSTRLMTKLTFIINLMTFNSYYSTSILFSFWSFLGSWKLYQLISTQYKKYYKQLAYAILFIPACIFWSSGILKESITTGAIGFSTFYFLRGIHKKKVDFKAFIIIYLCFYITINVKGITIYLLYLSLFIYLIILFLRKFNNTLRYFFIIIIFLSSPLILYLSYTEIIKNISQNDEFKQAQTTISGFQGDHGRIQKGHGGGSASTYTLSNSGDITPLGMIKSIPEAINVTLFRPYLWETSKIIQLLGALESLVFLMMSLIVLIKIGPIKIFNTFISNPILISFLLYSLMFGFVAGFISYNFGVLQRFKTPILPFYTSILVILYYSNKPRKLRKKVRIKT
ncbi:hypothetical protein [Flammeovirga pacifica]|uniref:Glycosyltransferase RgtA/B/C/D-like domain-containing protein n=1 Tax=Flammeovirga pacifica TaxID=915059 RepID=A0A1S1YX19_FLAPC|nr:hypothetical protein [Flammeovirga pacifica]OHX65554.1 hypothetical protein NH26_03925 [Flammeovirga pacifica]